ncbi:MAG: dTMP kinase [Verrucomicrobiia bacterium]|jgi:dTMP kinase
MSRGLFITFEGTEGCGKTTQIKLLANRIESEFDVPIIVLREPGGTPIGEEIRYILKHSPDNVAMTPEAELLLMNASRAQLVREVIRPALKEGKIVLCDRFYDSTVAYQGYGRGLNLDDVYRVINIAVGDTRPDLTILLSIPLELSLQRRKVRNNSNNGEINSTADKKNTNLRDRFEEADNDFFRRVHYGFEQIAKQEPQRIKVLDATKPIDEVFEEVWSIVKAYIQKFKQNPDE